MWIMCLFVAQISLDLIQAWRLMCEPVLIWLTDPMSLSLHQLNYLVFTRFFHLNMVMQLLHNIVMT